MTNKNILQTAGKEMQNKLYLDGCSLVYGDGLTKEQSLGNLFAELGGYDVTNLSRSGKSNLAIALDAYKNCQGHDVVILGFTFSSRFYIKYNEHDLDFFVGLKNNSLSIDNDFLDEAHINVYKYFYTVFGHPYCDELSDLLIDGVISFLKSQNKKVIAFSWEPRKVKSEIFYPYIPPRLRLSDGHLNQQGMIALYDYLQNINGRE